MEHRKRLGAFPFAVQVQNKDSELAETQSLNCGTPLTKAGGVLASGSKLCHGLVFFSGNKASTSLSLIGGKNQRELSISRDISPFRLSIVNGLM